MLKLGIVGMGHVAQYHVQGIAAAPGLQLVATADPKPLPDGLETDCPHFPSFADMHAAVSLDLVVIATPPATHLDLASAALHAGVDVLLEKPATPERHSYGMLLDAASQAKSNLYIALHSAFGREMDWFRAHRRELTDRFGPPTSVSCQLLDPYVRQDSVLPQAVGLCGSWRDSGINALSVLDLILPIEHVEVTAARFSLCPNLPEFDCKAVVDLVWPGGRGAIETNWTQGKNLKTTEVGFAEATLLLHHSAETVHLTSGDVTEEVDCTTAHVRLANHYIGLFDRFDADRDKHDFGHAERLHRLLFDALDFAPKEETTDD